jgi:ubiquinone/menaquinone biosynthesis C-methylase UbiE
LETDVIVELGAGYGYVASNVANKFREVIAIEPAPKKVQHMHSTYPKLDCILAVGEAIPFRDSSFEKGYAKKSLHHMTDIDQAMGELNRILKPTGCLFVNELKPGGRWRIIDWIERKIRRVHVNFLTPDALKQRLEKVGFSVTSLEDKASGYYLVAKKTI